MQLFDRTKFFLERQFVKGAHFQLLAMALFVVLLSILGGILVFGTEPGERLGEAIWWAFLRLSDPGYLGDDEGFRRRAISTVLTLGGYVVVLGTLVAIMTRWLINLMRQLERGLTPVTSTGHIVVLGWTDRTQAILREILVSRSKLKTFLALYGRKKTTDVVVLAEDITPEITHSLRNDPALSSRIGDVILRSGSSLNVTHLQRAAITQAAAIILPAQVFDEEEAVNTDVQTMKILLSLDGLIREHDGFKPPVVAEIQDGRKFKIARRAYTGPLEIVVGDRAISRLMVQNFLHPGLSEVYNELLSSEGGNEIYIRFDSGIAGKSYGEASQWFPNAVFCGVVRREEQGRFVSHLNPRLDFEFREGDGAVLICKSNEGEVLNGSFAATPVPLSETEELAQGAVRAKGQRRAPALRLLILGWSSKVRVLLEELLEYRIEDLEVTIVSTVSATERESRLLDYLGARSNGRFRQEEADFTVGAELRRFEPAEYDQILLISSDRVETGEEADARTLMAYLSLEELLVDARTPPEILIELADENNRALLGPRRGEVIISPQLISHMLAQLAMRRELRVVLEELFTAGGAEFLFRTLAEYGLPAGIWSFSRLKEEVLRRGETLVGVGSEINPPGSKTWTLTEAERLTVIATTVEPG